MALFAVFGAFATLVLASFGGTRRDKLIAHLGLAVVGSVVLTIGTAVSGTAWLAAIVTIPVAFGIFFAGVAGPNAASGVTAALLAYVLPVASAGAMGTVPSRLAGWWLAAVVSTAAVLLLSPKTPADRLRAVAAAVPPRWPTTWTAAARDEATPALLEAIRAAKHELVTQFAATPYRPTGLATADQALASVVQLLEWCTALVSDALDGHLDLSQAAPGRSAICSALPAACCGTWRRCCRARTPSPTSTARARPRRQRGPSAGSLRRSGPAPAVHHARLPRAGDRRGRARRRPPTP